MDAFKMLPILLGEFYQKLNLVKGIVISDIWFPEAPGKIKVAIGMRRTGKTYLLYQEIIKVLNEGIDKRTILYLNFEDDRLLPLSEQKLASLVDAFYSLYPEIMIKNAIFSLMRFKISQIGLSLSGVCTIPKPLKFF